MSRLGEVSRELVLELPGEVIERAPALPLDPDRPPAAPDPAGVLPPTARLMDVTSSGGGMMSDKPATEADLITDRDR